MGFTLIGLALLSMASSYAFILTNGGLIGMGSAVFHPKLSRVARMASGGHQGLAQSLFQKGGNAGASLRPSQAAFVVLPERSAQHRAVPSGGADCDRLCLMNVGAPWYKHRESLGLTARAGRVLIHPSLLG